MEGEKGRKERSVVLLGQCSGRAEAVEQGEACLGGQVSLTGSV